MDTRWMGIRVAAGALAAGGLAIVALELNAAVCPCAKGAGDGYHDLCVAADAADIELQARRAAWRKLSDSYRAGANPDGIIDEFATVLVVYVEPAAIGGANGIACWQVTRAFVRDDLPPSARRYVTLHELLHFADPDLSEFAVNVAATRVEPWGMVQTAGGSIASNVDDHRSWSCKLASLWRTFKVYFLPFQAP